MRFRSRLVERWPGKYVKATSLNWNVINLNVFFSCQCSNFDILCCIFVNQFQNDLHIWPKLIWAQISTEHLLQFVPFYPFLFTQEYSFHCYTLERNVCNIFQRFWEMEGSSAGIMMRLFSDICHRCQSYLS